MAGGSVVRDSDGVLWQMSTNKLSSPCPQIRFLQSQNSSLVKKNFKQFESLKVSENAECFNLRIYLVGIVVNNQQPILRIF